MDAIVLTTANSKTEDAHRLRLEFSSDLKLQDNLVSMSHLTLHYTWKNFSKKYDNTGLTYVHIPSGTTHVITIPDGSYSIRDVNNFIHHEMTLRSHVKSDGSFGINVYANSVYNRVTINVSADYSLKMSPGLQETFGFEKGQATLTNGDYNGLNPARIERVNNVLVHCSLVNNKILYDSSIIYAFVPNSSFGSLLEFNPNYSFWRNTRNASYNYVEVWFTDQENEPLEIEDDVLVEIQVIPTNLI